MIPQLAQFKEANHELQSLLEEHRQQYANKELEIIALIGANRELLKAEKEVSDAYLRVRALLKAYDTNHGGENRFEVTENRIRELLKDKDRLTTLLNLTDNEAEDGSWKVTLNYNNYQDGAQIVDGNGKIVGDCYDVGLGPNDQFRKALDKATLAKGENQ